MLLCVEPDGRIQVASSRERTPSQKRALGDVERTGRSYNCSISSNRSDGCADGVEERLNVARSDYRPAPAADENDFVANAESCEIVHRTHAARDAGIRFFQRDRPSAGSLDVRFGFIAIEYGAQSCDHQPGRIRGRSLGSSTFTGNQNASDRYGSDP
jgi:hypothetical protein